MRSTNKETVTSSRLSPRRHWTNLLTRYTVGVGGGAVIGAITLIFAYLLWVVAPILLPAEIEDPAEYDLSDRPTTLIDVSENGEVIFRASADGFIEFFSIEDGRVLRVQGDVDLVVRRVARTHLEDHQAVTRGARGAV